MVKEKKKKGSEREKNEGCERREGRNEVKENINNMKEDMK